jgi:hypothetical protein
MPGDLSYSDTGQLTARSERGAGKQDLAHRHDARRWSQTSGSLLGRGQANGIGLVPSSLRLPPHRTIRCLPFTMASATNPSAANGSMSGQTAAKWCEMRIATAANPACGPFRKPVAHSSARLAKRSRSPPRSPPTRGAASVTAGTARPYLAGFQPCKGSWARPVEPHPRPRHECALGDRREHRDFRRVPQWP